ncbi:MAG TPA: Ig-like domain-containing protein [Jatrophihabitans sp.]|nr:Ig-like domain-containing protein [Jatrophihabitans sp.]
MTAALAAAPFAHAETAPTPSPQPSPNPTAGKAAASHPKPAVVTTSASSSTIVVPPNFGLQKIRVGTQIKSGAWVPPGTNTGNTQIKIDETGPGAPGVYGNSCTTLTGSEDPNSTETYCFFTPPVASVRAVKKAGLIPATLIPATAPTTSQDYFPIPGDTVTFTQTTVRDNLVIDSVSKTVPPCVTVPSNDYPLCDPSGVFDVVFNDGGLPPAAKNDTASVLTGKSVDVKVGKNDFTNGAPTTVTHVSNPKHGAATIVGTGPNAQSISYKSDAGFVGTDSFTYTISTPNGTSSATVKVTVLAPPPTAANDSATTTSGNSVTINVLGNDSANGGGALHVSSVAAPAHGSARISGGAVVYTPDAGFVGADTFSYVAATAFGSATGTVTVTVTASHGLASTGSSDSRIAEIAILMLITGGAATVVGRRRYRAKHVGLH